MTPPDISTDSDRHVVRAARNGDETAYRELFRRYQDRVLASVYRIVGNRERAQDLTQETFTKAFDSLDRYGSERHFAPWLLTIANNTARNYVNRCLPDSAISPWAVTPTDIPTANGWVSGASEAAPQPNPNAALMDAFNRLPPTQRKCVELRYLKGLSNRAVAKRLGLREGAVKTNLSRAKSTLKRLMEPPWSA